MNTLAQVKASPLLHLFPELWGEVRGFLNILDHVSLQQTCRLLCALTPGSLYPSFFPSYEHLLRDYTRDPETLVACTKHVRDLVILATRNNVNVLPKPTSCGFYECGPLGSMFGDLKYRSSWSLLVSWKYLPVRGDGISPISEYTQLLITTWGSSSPLIEWRANSVTVFGGDRMTMKEKDSLIRSTWEELQESVSFPIGTPPKGFQVNA
jgi:hypothetical protein